MRPREFPAEAVNKLIPYAQNPRRFNEAAGVPRGSPSPSSPMDVSIVRLQ